MTPNIESDISTNSTDVRGSTETNHNGATAVPVDPPRLTRYEARNVIFLVLSFSCVVSSLTMIIGSGDVLMASIGGSHSIVPFTLGCFFLGMSLVSLTTTHWIFARYGRKVGFWCGCAIAIGGSALGCGALYWKSPAVLLVADLICGAGGGIGMYLRFASVEVVTAEFATKAVAWTLCGGCLAAFVGPETSIAVAGAFGDGSLTYLGVYIVAICFNVAQAGFVALIRFDVPPPTVTTSSGDASGTPRIEKDTTATRSTLEVDVEADVSYRHPHEEKSPTMETDVELSIISLGIPEPTDIATSLGESETANNDDILPESANKTTITATDDVTLLSLLKGSDFILPLLVAILSWSIMAMPMGMFRVAMRQLGFTDRQSLLVIAFHFLAMYSPGFWTGKFIMQYGSIRACQVAIGCFLLATTINLVSQNNNNTTASWYLGMVFLGIGWNFGFSSATVWVTKVYQKAPHMKARVQAANECVTFFVSGALLFSAGYIYSYAGGGGLNGWRTINYTVLGMILLLIAVVLFAMSSQERQRKRPAH